MKKVRDYHKKHYKNPFFRKVKRGSATRGRGFYYGREPSRFKTLRKTVVLILLLAVAIGWFYFLFYSPYFSIQKIEIFGLEKIDETEIKKLLQLQIASHRFLIFKQKNIFWFDEESAKKIINLNYGLTFLEINKKLPDTLIVKLEEKKPFFIWVTGEKFYYVDQDGMIIHELAIEEVSAAKNQKEIPLVYDENNQEIKIKDTVLTPSLIQFIVNLHKAWFEKINLSIIGFVVTHQPDTMVKASTLDGWQIYFTSNRDLNLQIEKLSLFLKEMDKEKISEYIDLRFEDRVYYK